MRIAVFAVPFLLGVICHEVAHGLMALKLGDPTAKTAGRLTLNPLPHLDPMGTMVFIVTSLMPMGVVFGWAKPVPVDPRYFKDPRRGMMAVSAAGPATNFLLAAMFFAAFRLLGADGLRGAGAFTSFFGAPLVNIAVAGVFVNVILGVLNLIPIPPLDGSKIVAGVLPRRLAMRYLSLERYGLLILFALIFFGGLDYVFAPVIRFVYGLLG